MALKDALQAINEAFNDLTSLHVQTYTGVLDFDAKPTKTSSAFDKVRDYVKGESAKPNGKIRLVAEAYVQFDGDSYNFVTEEDVPARALELHRDAVEAGINTRRGLMELIVDVFD
jgi:hypothetical protein